MLRSFFARPNPLLSHLRRHDRRAVAQLGRRADEIQARSYSYTSSGDETDSDADGPEAKDRRQHLYVVLDDWNKGFSIHKLDLDDGSDGGDLTLRAPVHRQATGDPQWKFAAVGSKIVAAGGIKSNKDDDYVTLVYDTEAAGLSIVPRLPTALHRGGWARATAAGNTLYTFEHSSRGIWEYDRGMHILENAQASRWATMDYWSWSSIPTPLPFNVHTVESTAVHPEGEGRTLFVSVRDRREDDTQDYTEDDLDPDVNRDESPNGTFKTFSYDAGSDGEWKHHGDWDLPFYGQAHYNTELDAWVGLHKIHEQDYHATDGYLCSCDVASLDGSPVQPAWKLCAEGLLDHYDLSPIASLVYMGGSNYCLVQIITPERRRPRKKCVMRVARFRLKYGKKGELLVTDRPPNRSYQISRFHERHDVPAFWM